MLRVYVKKLIISIEMRVNSKERSDKAYNEIKGVNEGKEKDDNFIKEYTSKDSRK